MSNGASSRNDSIAEGERSNRDIETCIREGASSHVEGICGRAKGGGVGNGDRAVINGRASRVGIASRKGGVASPVLRECPSSCNCVGNGRGSAVCGCNASTLSDCAASEDGAVANIDRSLCEVIRRVGKDPSVVDGEGIGRSTEGVIVGRDERAVIDHGSTCIGIVASEGGCTSPILGK